MSWFKSKKKVDYNKFSPLELAGFDDNKSENFVVFHPHGSDSTVVFKVNNVIKENDGSLRIKLLSNTENLGNLSFIKDLNGIVKYGNSQYGSEDNLAFVDRGEGDLKDGFFTFRLQYI